MKHATGKIELYGNKMSFGPDDEVTIKPILNNNGYELTITRPDGASVTTPIIKKGYTHPYDAEAIKNSLPPNVVITPLGLEEE